MKRDFTATKRIVIKIGTATLSRQADHAGISTGNKTHGPLDIEFMHRIAQQIATLMREGKQVLLVSSGAIGMGARELGMSKRVQDINMRQACAAIGQPLLMEEYRKVFGVYGITVAQILITREVWDNRQSYLNLRNSINTLLEMKVLPIFNENDTISTAEIGNAFGDNDQLSAYIASKSDAELLFLLTDIDALYTANPKTHPEATIIRYVNKITREIRDGAGERGSEFSTGGMLTKLKAVDIAREAGCRVILAHGRTENLLPRAMAGEEIGTLFEAAHPLKNRTRWIKNASPAGTITIDSGAMKALTSHNSLLVKGITEVHGHFDRGAIVLVNDSIKLVSAFSSSELEAIKGKNSADVKIILGDNSDAIVARPEDMAFLSELDEG